METQKLTNSMRSKWNSCHRAFKISTIDKIRPICSSDALRFGTAFHSMMEVYWTRLASVLNDDESKNLYVEDVICEIANQYALDNCDDYGAKTLLALFDGYVAKNLQSDRSKYETIGVEMEYNAPLLNPETGGKSLTYHLAGKLDGIIRNKADGSIVILEHKTTSSDIDPTSDYWKKLAIDGQVSGYYYGIQFLGYEAKNCLYDVIRKPTIKVSNSVPELDENGLKIVIDETTGERVFKKDGSPRQSAGEGMKLLVRKETSDEWFDRLSADIQSNLDKYFARMEIARSDSDLEDYLFDMWALSKELMEAKKSGRYSRNPAGCQMFSGCEYWDVCTGSASLDDSTRFEKIETANPELSTK